LVGASSKDDWWLVVEATCLEMRYVRTLRRAAFERSTADMAVGALALTDTTPPLAA